MWYFFIKYVLVMPIQYHPFMASENCKLQLHPCSVACVWMMEYGKCLLDYVNNRMGSTTSGFRNTIVSFNRVLDDLCFSCRDKSSVFVMLFRQRLDWYGKISWVSMSINGCTCTDMSFDVSFETYKVCISITCPRQLTCSVSLSQI